MKYLILPAKELQTGDVVFVPTSNAPNVSVCARVLGLNSAARDASIVQFRVEPLVSSEDNGHTVLTFENAQLVGVAREDAYVEVDVSALLASLDE